MAISKSPAIVFRDFETDGVPASGAFAPIKSEVRTLLNEIIAGLGGETGGIHVDASKVNHFVLPSGNLATSGDALTAFGIDALVAVTSGDNNTALGYRALYSVTEGSGNTGLGFAAGHSTTTGNDNTALGNNALVYNVTGEGNVAVGSGALNNYLGSEGTAVGANALQIATGVGNVGIGAAAGLLVETGTNNVFIGFAAGGVLGQTDASNAVAIGKGAIAFDDCVVIGANAHSTGSSQVVLGTADQNELFFSDHSMMKVVDNGFRNYFFGPAGNLTTTGGACIGIGESALSALVDGSAHVAIGDFAGAAIQSAAGSIAIGASALRNAVNPTDTIAIGWEAFKEMTTGTGGTAVGRLSFSNATTANNNTGIGDSTGRFTTTGGSNCAMGYRSFEGNTTGSFNVCLGGAAMVDRQGGDGNVAVGYGAIGTSGVTALGSYNVAVGFDAGKALRNGSDNIFIGRDAGDDANQLATAQNSIAIGKGVYNNASNQIVIGNDSHVDFIAHASTLKIGRDVVAPSTKLLTGQNALAGTANAAGADLVITPGRGTGTGTGGRIIFQVAPETTSGSTQNPLIDAVRINRFGALEPQQGLNLGSSNYQFWTSRTGIYSPADGQFAIRNNNGSQAAVIDIAGGLLRVDRPIACAPGASVTPVNNGDVTFQLTNNTTLTFKAKGSDGTVRSGTLTLA